MKIEVTQCSMCKHYSEEQYCEIWQQYITNDTFYCACGATADRKTEPTISKMEQVDEPQADCGDFADRLAYERGVKHAWEVAQKVFNSTVTFYEAENVAKQIDKDINVRSKDCETCKHYKLACELFSEICKYEPTTQTETQNSNLTFKKRTMLDCYNCKRFDTEDECIECRYEPKDELQTDTEIAKAIVHKMIDDAVIAEDAYPDLRQKMHDAVDEYEPQTDCAWKKGE